MSDAAKKVAKYGSYNQYEYMSLIDLKSGNELVFHTDKEFDSVGGKVLRDFLENNKDASVAFIHNHNESTKLSFPDVEIMANNNQIKLVAAVRNDGIISVIESNGKHTTEYLPLRYDNEVIKYRDGKYGKYVPIESTHKYMLEKEQLLINLTIEEFAEGGMIIYE